MSVTLSVCLSVCPGFVPYTYPNVTEVANVAGVLFALLSDSPRDEPAFLGEPRFFI